MPTEYMDREAQNTGEVICGHWRESVPNAFLEQGPTVLGCRGTRRAEEIRNTLKDFFNGPGALSWQENILKLLFLQEHHSCLYLLYSKK